MKKIGILLLGTLIFAVQVSATTISMGISGPGAVNDSTISMGKKVTFNIYVENEGNFKGFTMGFKLFSKNIKNIIHPQDSTNGLNKNGDIKGYNGFNDRSIWDLGGVYVVEKDWDGILPDLVGFGGVSKSKPYAPHKAEKKLSFDLIFNEPGTFIVDSSFFPPTGKWMFAPPNTFPVWGGPYKFKVTK